MIGLLAILGIIIISRIASPDNNSSTETRESVNQGTLITKIIKSHFSDADVEESPNIIATFDMKQTTVYHPDMTALHIVESVCELRKAGHGQKSMRFIAEIETVNSEGNRITENGINVIFFSEDAPAMECDEPRTIGAETWLELMPELAGSFYLNPILE